MELTIKENVSNIINTIEKILKKEKTISEDNSSLISCFNLWFHYSRYYSASWDNEFNEELKMKFGETEQYNILCDIFSLSIKLNDNHFYYLEQIVSTKSMPSLYINLDSKCNPFVFLNSYKEHLLTKHFISFFFHFIRASNYKHNKYIDLFEDVKKKSISGQLITNDNDCFVFSIPKNRSSVFIFKYNKRFVFIDVSISQEIDELNTVPHFIIAHSSAEVEDTSIFKKLLLNNCEMEHEDIFNSMYDDNKISFNKLGELVKPNCDYILCHENGYDYSFSNKDQLSIFKLIGIENPKLFNKKIPNDFYKILFNHLLHSTGKIKQNIHSRDYYISNIIKILPENEELLNLPFSEKDLLFIKKAIQYKLGFISNYLDHHHKNNYDYFIKACENSNIEKTSDIDSILFTFSIESNFNKLFCHIEKDEHIKQVRNYLSYLSILEILKENKENKDIKNIGDQIRKIDSRFNNRKVKEMIKNIH